MPMCSFDCVGGSSPHARGAPHRPKQRVPVRGIIPACAGSTHRGKAGNWHQWDHPRMRGEHADKVDQQVVDMGSSPHARGALYDLRYELVQLGIIPACAGSTFACGFVRCFARDHPRMRGEHSCRVKTSTLPTGSSPHARGAHIPVSCNCHGTGIIPACAGSTDILQIADKVVGDHPRMRGEHYDARGWAAEIRGSSPHARGALF